MPDSGKYKRVNILISKDQYQRISEEELSLSGLVRDLLDDRFSQSTIVLSVTPETKALYDRVVSNYGVTDRELELEFVDALDALLAHRTEEIRGLRQRLRSVKGKKK